MNKAIRNTVLAAFGFGVVAPFASAGDLGIAVTITGEVTPGVYGRVDLTNRPPPTLVYAQPVIVEQPPPEAAPLEPIYLHVPPDHARDWHRHCHEYHACNRRVYFVRSEEYEPGYVRERDRGHGHHDDDRDRDHDRGHHEHEHEHHHDD